MHSLENKSHIGQHPSVSAVHCHTECWFLHVFVNLTQANWEEEPQLRGGLISMPVGKPVYIFLIDD